MKIFRYGTLFSGIGAPEQAVSRVFGLHKQEFAVEFDKYARQAYITNYNISSEKFHCDIKDFIPPKVKLDCIIGGSPCQDFSIAGRGKGFAGFRGSLTGEFLRVIGESLPETFIFENVPGITRDMFAEGLSEFKSQLIKFGYHLHIDFANAKDYNIPQSRKRYFIVGFLNKKACDNFRYAPKVPLTKRLLDVLEDDVDEKYYLSQKMVDNYTSSSSGNEYINQNTQASKVHNIYKESPTISAGTHGYIKIAGNLNHYKYDMLDRVYNKDSISPSIRTFQGGGAVHKVLINHETQQNIGVLLIDGQKFNIRKLTPRECLRLQDFPDSFKIVTSDTQAYKQAGNSMTVGVIEMLLARIEIALSVV